MPNNGSSEQFTNLTDKGTMVWINGLVYNTFYKLRFTLNACKRSIFFGLNSKNYLNVSLSTSLTSLNKPPDNKWSRRQSLWEHFLVTLFQDISLFMIGNPKIFIKQSYHSLLCYLEPFLILTSKKLLEQDTFRGEGFLYLNSLHLHQL